MNVADNLLAQRAAAISICFLEQVSLAKHVGMIITCPLMSLILNHIQSGMTSLESQLSPD